jgi:adenylosuccinate lyase
MHERLRQHALAAWESRKNEQKNPLAEWIKADPVFQRYLPTNELESLMDISRYLGDAPERARALADEIKEQIFKPQP